MPEIIECESGTHPVVDAHGQPLEVGSPVRYGGTGTTGHVTEIICDSEGAWAIIDTKDLLYKLESLTLLTELQQKDEMGERQFTKEEIEEVLEKAKDDAKEARLDDANLEAGG
ncbi:MAG: DUF2098 domain-containing protein [ANME-2 cluster archaeon]|nr:DUF2098 domain-containing protein [ANME-2 cluster archaeon]